jgi:hypothetical protein
MSPYACSGSLLESCRLHVFRRKIMPPIKRAKEYALRQAQRAQSCSWSSWLDDVHSKHVSAWSAEGVLCLFHLLPLVAGVWLMIAAYRS